jgi:hypothetical protein
MLLLDREINSMRDRKFKDKFLNVFVVSKHIKIKI